MQLDIQVIGNRENLILDSWEKCQPLVIGYQAIYKSFKSKTEAEKYLESIKEEEIKEILDEKKYYAKKKKFPYKEMIYKPKQELDILAHDTYLGYEFYIISTGLFPCAYIKINKNNKLYGKDLEEVNKILDFYRQITFSKKGLVYDFYNWYIGIDYAHVGDFIGSSLLLPEELLIANERKYSTKEIYQDVQDLIKKVKNLQKYIDN